MYLFKKYLFIMHIVFCVPASQKGALDLSYTLAQIMS